MIPSTRQDALRCTLCQTDSHTWDVLETPQKGHFGDLCWEISAKRPEFSETLNQVLKAQARSGLPSFANLYLGTLSYGLWEQPWSMSLRHLDVDLFSILLTKNWMNQDWEDWQEASKGNVELETERRNRRNSKWQPPQLEIKRKKWQVALVKLDPWYALIWRQVDEQRSASWYSFKYWFVRVCTGSMESSAC